MVFTPVDVTERDKAQDNSEWNTLTRSTAIYRLRYDGHAPHVLYPAV